MMVPGVLQLLNSRCQRHSHTLWHGRARIRVVPLCPMVSCLIRDADCRDGCLPAAESFQLSGYPDVSRVLDVFPDQAIYFPV